MTDYHKTGKLESKPVSGYPDIMLLTKPPRKKVRKKKPIVLDVVPEEPKRKKVNYSRREIAGMVVEDQIELFKRLGEQIFNAPPGTDFQRISKSGLYNTWLACGESLWKKMGLDAAMISEEARKSALEIVGDLWEGGVHKCPECGHRWGKG